jgi:GNAT superfamily N-acetyltransferase
MEFLEYFSSENKEHWLQKIEECDWDAGKYLAYLLKTNGLFDLVGEGSRVLMLTDGDELVSFCTLAKYDDVQPTELTPWSGWIYTFPAYRGRRLAGKLLEYAENLARKDGAVALHISTNHDGLYEKYGYEFLKYEKDVEGEDTKVYIKRL